MPPFTPLPSASAPMPCLAPCNATVSGLRPAASSCPRRSKPYRPSPYAFLTSGAGSCPSPPPQVDIQGQYRTMSRQSPHRPLGEHLCAYSANYKRREGVPSRRADGESSDGKGGKNPPLPPPIACDIAICIFNHWKNSKNIKKIHDSATRTPLILILLTYASRMHFFAFSAPLICMVRILSLYLQC